MSLEDQHGVAGGGGYDPKVGSLWASGQPSISASHSLRVQMRRVLWKAQSSAEGTKVRSQGSWRAHNNLAVIKRQGMR